MSYNNEKIDLPPLPQYPQPSATFRKFKSFLDNKRKYNCALQLTSFGCKEVTLHEWNPQFRIQGPVCHLIGPLMPPTDSEPTFLHSYIMDGTAADQVERRCRITHGLRPLDL